MGRDLLQAHSAAPYRRGWRWAACMVAPIVGAAAQLQQAALWPLWVNLGVLAAGVLTSALRDALAATGMRGTSWPWRPSEA